MAHRKRSSHTRRASSKRVAIDLTDGADTEDERDHRSATIAPAVVPTSATVAPSTMTLYVKDLVGPTLTLRNVLSSWTVADIKQALCDLNHVPVALQRLVYKGRMLTDAQTAEAVGLTDGNGVLLLVLKL